ncbi:3-ketoacyl-CoA thiolase [bacterium BMS3Abin02]|nr:3-ketoacyl-CoA thiolase [bacterium BMS3Abin02]GBE21149.1 3-ketoacyl-CoA thiolase [bacterium BMS3Bbin01]HDH24852.1 thiolase family protein [Actinomycetota bacterium]HDL49237.1 thiolase family protein [Actinomycetota bacterium]
MSTGVVVTHAYRTAVGKAYKGSLRETRPDELLGLLIQGFIGRVPELDSAAIDDVIIGCAMPEGEQGMNVGRIAALRAGLPVEVPAMTMNRFCSSGLQTLATGATHVAAGFSDIVLTGGVESMTIVPMGGNKPAPNPWLAEHMPTVYESMGMTSENVAARFGISREEQDRFALESHRRALDAQKKGRFADEILPVQVRLGDGSFVFDTDDGPRESTLEGLAKLRPAFKVDGTSTAGNSSQMSDGAALELLMTREKAEEFGFKPLGELVTFQVAGVDPAIMGIGPSVAIPKALDAAGLTLDDIGLIELNEAFASQAVYCIRELGIDPEKVNVNGGAIALGHPLGCTGAKLTATLLHEMKRRDVEYGIVSMCIGGGMGAAGIFRRG